MISRAPLAHSLDGTWTGTEVPAGASASYPMPVKTADGTLFVFYRETTNELDPNANPDSRPMKYIACRDNGKTWKNSVQLTGKQWAFGSLGRADHMDEIYVGQLRYLPSSGRIQFVYTLAGGGPSQHKHDVYHRNVYYLSFDVRTLRFFSAAASSRRTTSCRSARNATESRSSPGSSSTPRARHVIRGCVERPELGSARSREWTPIA
ncbi:BNR-4 repeat-containing protein [Amycolatopsis sp. cmx-11-51]|uniref:BNR-4 repeat-containing protein n=1 Tax=Amycolatopsis sp. cmx-11-51 TaxID=2785797 RepID=UPI0039E52922